MCACVHASLCVCLCVCMYICGYICVCVCVIKSTDMFSIVVRSSVCSPSFCTCAVSKTLKNHKAQVTQVPIEKVSCQSGDLHTC